MTTDTIYLFDGSAYIFRAFYATPRLTNANGDPTNALYGFTRMCLKFLRETNPQHALMVFDAGAETFRNELYEEYKANRDECPPDLKVQMPHFRTISRALGFPVIELPGYEADDVIGTIACALGDIDRDVVIVSADKDLMQLVTERVTMWDTMRDRRFDIAGVKEKLGVEPGQVIDYLALAGDSSDNIPGLKGAGPKTAVQLVSRYGSVEKILESSALIREDKEIRSRKKIADQIEENSDIVRLSKELVTVRCDAPLECAELIDGIENPSPGVDEENLRHFVGVDNLQHLLSALKFRGADEVLLGEVVEEFQFGSLVEEYGLKGGEKTSALEQSYHVIFRDDFDAWCKRFREQEIFAFDLETTSLNVHEAEVVGFACCWDEREAFYIPCRHNSSDKKQVSFDELIEALRDRLESPDVKKVGQNLKYDNEVLLTHGVRVRGVWFDTMIAAYLLHPDLGGYGLSNLAKEHLGHTMIEYSDIVGDGELFSDVSIDTARNYAAEDAHITWLLYEKFAPQIETHELNRVCYEVESPLIEVLSAIEHYGIRLDADMLRGISAEVAVELERLQGEIYEAAGEEFNQNSPKQLGEILFTKLGIPTKGIKKTKSGYSTNQAVLEQIRDLHPVPALILEYRGLHKLRSTYLESLPREISSVTGRLHTKLNQTIAATGRLSSSEPNLQNIPIQTELGRTVRKAFIPSEGAVFIAADYSQIELRVLAHMSEDEGLIESFQNGIDIHERTAREILELPEEYELSGEERRLGKTMNFGIVYGMSGFRLARELGIPVSEGTAYIHRYFSRYPRVREFFDRIEREMEDTGEVRTMLGRRRVVREIDAGRRDKNFVKRAALNAPLQGSAADLIKLAMIRMYSRIHDDALPLRMVLQVHDELLFEVDLNESADSLVKEMSEVVREEMEGVLPLRVPLVVDVATGMNWEEAHS
jgi:DNA polymerase-1